MDKEIRNHIQRATQAARTLLEHEYAEQLEGTFDIRLDGTIAAEAGEHLDAQQRVLRTKLVAAVEHVRSSVVGHQSAAEAVTDYLREAAFTTLNRFVALKMLEARRLVQECISRGEQSAGFKEFTGLAPGLVQLPDHGYRLYIESLFDEIGREVRVLFDRRDPASLLWPRRQALQQLLDILNDPDLARLTTDDGRPTTIWHEDETIGWVYQYFNSDEERRQMRAESQAPRNSRELAVRNQFFTPRYVVEFLTDNTLGRIWYEMLQGKTRLVNECDYLVRRPTEIFLAEGAPAPEDDSTRDENLSQEELLKKPVYIPFRAKKDPRDLKLLDPACGSGHFLLYAFDLLISIYEEAWEDDSSPSSEVTGSNLRDDYPNLEDFRCTLPGLILRHNLHGVDIDPRAAQIAALALWMRAQRAYNDFGIACGERSPISKTNIVVAEPMPGEKEFRQEFIASLDKQLGRLVECVFEKMKLAGEFGSLLKIDDEIQSAIRNVYGETGELFRKSDEERWQEAEDKLLRALHAYAERAQNGQTYRRRLFADDTAQGFAFVDLCRQRFDTILMNPPFGDGPERGKKQIAFWYPPGSADLGAAFVLRTSAQLTTDGRVGAITNRTLLAVQGFEVWRRAIMEDAGLYVLIDLGHGVLDAMVETAMYVCGASGPSRNLNPGLIPFGGLLESTNKLQDLSSSLKSGLQWREASEFVNVPGSPWAYWVPHSLLFRFANQPSFLSSGAEIVPGIQTGDDFRFYRLRWEVPPTEIHTSADSEDFGFEKHRWTLLAKGGEYSLWWDDLHLVQRWYRSGEELRNFVDFKSGKLRSRPQNLDKMFRRGATYPYRTTSAFGLRLLSPGVSFSVGGWAIFAPEDWTDEAVLATYNSRVARYFMEVLLGQGDTSASGTAARNHVAAAIGGIPRPPKAPRGAEESVQQLIDGAALSTLDETALFFRGSQVFRSGPADFDSVRDAWWKDQCDTWIRTSELYLDVERAVVSAYELSTDELAAIAESEGESLAAYPRRSLAPNAVSELFRATVEELTAKAKEVCGAKRYTVKKAYFIERSVDLASHIFRAHPDSVIEAARQAGSSACGASAPFARALLGWILGHAVGRFHSGNSHDNLGPSALEHLPSRALEETNNGLPIWVDDPGHADDIIALVNRSASRQWSDKAELLLMSAVHATGWSGDLRAWYRSEFFEMHISTYSKSRRKAPIYWQLAPPSASYSVWLYYHRFTKDTFYKVLNDYVTPKLQHEERKHTGLVQIAGGNATASQRKEIAEQEVFVEELRVFRAEIARIAPLWNPDLNDGVIINFAPLWRLVPQHRAWQKECKSCWDNLVAGDYDWAHLAMHLRPERVVPKCAEDRSLAIAHGLEEAFWVEGSNGKWQPRRVDPATIDQLIKERTSAAVKDALKSLLEAPVPAVSRRSSVAGRQRKGRSSASHRPSPARKGRRKVIEKAVADGE